MCNKTQVKADPSYTPNSNRVNRLLLYGLYNRKQDSPPEGDDQVPCNLFAIKLEMQCLQGVQGSRKRYFKKISKYLKKVLAKGLVARYTIEALEGEHKRAQTKALRN